MVSLGTFHLCGHFLCLEMLLILFLTLRFCSVTLPSIISILTGILFFPLKIFAVNLTV